MTIDDSFILNYNKFYDNQETVTDVYSFMKVLDKNPWIITRNFFCKDINVSIYY